VTAPEPISAELADLLAGTAVVCRQWAEQLEVRAFGNGYLAAARLQLPVI
jgi:hypothetical protein